MVTPCDAPTTATTIDSVTIDMTDASKTKTTDIVAQEADDDSNHVAVESSDDSNSAIMHGMLRKAVADPNQPSVDDWLVLPFSGEAVEEAYQANLAPGRAMGVVFAVVLSALWTLVFNTLGNAESSSSITLRIVTGTVATISLLRPSLWLSLAACAVCSTQLGVTGYNSNTFDSIGLSILAGTYSCAVVVLFVMFFEKSSRLSFVHQLAVTRYAEAATRHSEASRRSEAAASRAINHCAKRVMYDNIDWSDQIRDGIIPELTGKVSEEVVDKLDGIVNYIQTENREGYEKCRSAILLQQIAAGTYQRADDPVNLRTLVGDTWGTHPSMAWTATRAVPEWVMLPPGVIRIIMDNAVHNSTTHGEKRGPLSITVDAASAQDAAEDGNGSMMLSIHLRNNPGKFHGRALAHQAEQGRNFLFRDLELDVSSIGSKQSTFLGRYEMCEAAAAMDASIDLFFVGGEEPHTVFSLTTELRPCLEEPPSSSADADLDVLHPGSLLVCADDDKIARMKYRGIIKLTKPEDSIVLGESYEEAAGLVEIVLAEAAARGDEKVVCILDQNMEYAAGTILGTEITMSLREAGFKGIIVIRSANDDPTSRKMWEPAAI